jgi:hypothetical protein
MTSISTKSINNHDEKATSAVSRRAVNSKILRMRRLADKVAQISRHCEYLVNADREHEPAAKRPKRVQFEMHKNVVVHIDKSTKIEIMGETGVDNWMQFAKARSMTAMIARKTVAQLCAAEEAQEDLLSASSSSEDSDDTDDFSLPALSASLQERLQLRAHRAFPRKGEVKPATPVLPLPSRTKRVSSARTRRHVGGRSAGSNILRERNQTARPSSTSTIKVTIPVLSKNRAPAAAGCRKYSSFPRVSSSC